MSDPAAPDPIDQAYAQAETLLSDDEARAARRARVLGAVASQPAMDPVASSPLRRRPAWRRGGWLVAASVVGLSVFIASQIYEPVRHHPQTAPSAPTSAASTSAPAAPAPPTPATGSAAAGPPAAAPLEAREREAPVDASRGAAPAPSAPPGDKSPVAPPPPATVANAPAPRAFPEEAKVAPTEPVVVSAERTAPAPAANYAGTLSGGARDEVVDAQGGMTRRSARRASEPAFAETPAAAPPGRSASIAGMPSDPAARLRAAAAAGRTAELEALLDQGVPVDAPDADGNTALMKSLEADHPAAAAALSRHGASLDHRNHAGESARDIAAARGDAALNQAVGLPP